jgi:hypothetical protein
MSGVTSVGIPAAVISKIVDLNTRRDMVADMVAAGIPVPDVTEDLAAEVVDLFDLVSELIEDSVYAA